MCLIVDTSLEEASCVSCRIMAAVNEDKHLCSFIKEGRGGISATALHDALTVYSRISSHFSLYIIFHCSLLKMSAVI